jgi:hypothetical protein
MLRSRFGAGRYRAEPLRPKTPVTITDDFLTLRPSIDELLDHIGLNCFGYPRKSGGPYRRLGVEAILDTDEARFGCRVPFKSRRSSPARVVTE